MDDTGETTDPRAAAIRRIKARRNLTLQAATFAAVTVVLVVVWAIADGGFFWPIFPILGFAFALFGQWQALRADQPISEDQIRREMGQD